MFLHSHHLYEQLLRVPLIVRYPGRFEGGKRIAFPAQVCDIFHSILETVGIEAPVDPLGGQALPNHNDANSNGRLRVAEYIDKRAVRRDSMKLILHEKGPRELYDLDADPEELNNLAKERPEVVAEFEKAVAAWISQAKKT